MDCDNFIILQQSSKLLFDHLREALTVFSDLCFIKLLDFREENIEIKGQ